MRAVTMRIVAAGAIAFSLCAGQALSQDQAAAPAKQSVTV